MQGGARCVFDSVVVGGASLPRGHRRAARQPSSGLVPLGAEVLYGAHVSSARFLMRVAPSRAVALTLDKERDQSRYLVRDQMAGLLCDCGSTGAVIPQHTEMCQGRLGRDDGSTGRDLRQPKSASGMPCLSQFQMIRTATGTTSTNSDSRSGCAVASNAESPAVLLPPSWASLRP
jgi:hypothetical protein